MLQLSQSEAVLRMALALLLGVLIGAERQRGDRPAGMRTYALVCLGSALFMLVSAYAFPSLTLASGGRVDPTRIAAQVVTGIGFLGAGIIFTQRNVTRGLTTAAGLWVAAAIGLAVGAGMYFIASAGTVLMLIVLAALKPIEQRIFSSRVRLLLRVSPRPGQLASIQEALKASGVRVRSVIVTPADDNQETIEINCAPVPAPSLEALIERLRRIPGFVDIEVDRFGLIVDDGDA
ncbi:MAG TPA: MgtC/SapB family protein [Chloroflexota bacterium]